MSTDETSTEQEVEAQESQPGDETPEEATSKSSPQTEPQPEYQAADLKDLHTSSNLTTAPAAEVQGAELNLDVILDVPVTISVEIGRSQIPIRQLLQYNQGSVIELDRHVGEPLDVLVNKTLIAHGEVVMIDDQFGIRLTDVISPSERVKKLR